MELLPIVNKIVALFTIAGHIGIGLLIVSFFFPKTKSFALKIFGKYAIIFSFVVALGAVLGSLFYSEIAGLEPCKLCWFQRIFIYPQAIILGIAVWKKEKTGSFIDYILALSVIGALVAAYHYYFQLAGGQSVVCTGIEVSCSQKIFSEFGYVTMPMASFTAFLFIIISMLAKKFCDKKS